MKFSHPEQKPGELFFVNAAKRQLATLPFKTARLGRIAFDGNGRRLHHDDWFPVFISKAECDGSGVPLLELRRQHTRSVAAA